METTSQPSSEPGIEFEQPDFSALTEFVDGRDEVDTLAAAPQEETPVVEPVPEGAAAPPVVTPSVAPIEQGAIVAPPVIPDQIAVAAPEVKMPTKEELEGMYKTHREQTLPTFEKMFTLSDAEAVALDERPSQVLPKLAARLMYDTMLSTYNATIAAMPSVVTRLMDVQKTSQAAEQKFFSAWPDLASQSVAPVVSAAVRAYRSANPRADLDTVIKNAGVMAMIQLGKNPLPSAPAAVAAPKPLPAGPVAPRNTTQVAPPVRPGNQQSNVFADLTEAFLNEH